MEGGGDVKALKVMQAGEGRQAQLVGLCLE